MLEAYTAPFVSVKYFSIQSIQGRPERRLLARTTYAFSERIPQKVPHFWPALPEAGIFRVRLERHFAVEYQGNKPKTPTPAVVPTYTFPFAIIGVMNLFPFPK